MLMAACISQTMLDACGFLSPVLRNTVTLMQLFWSETGFTKAVGHQLTQAMHALDCQSSFCNASASSHSFAPATIAQLWPGEVSYKDFTADILGALLATCAAQLHERFSASSKQRPRMIDLAELGLLYGQPLSRGKNALLNLIGATKIAK